MSISPTVTAQLCLVIASVFLGETHAESAKQITQEIKHAETYYWFGMAEKGNLNAFRKGLAHLERARALLRSTPSPANQAVKLKQQIEALQEDIEQQADMAHDTFYGVFPLARLLAPSLFADAGALGTFELIDDPDVIAVSGAAEALSRSVLTEWKSKPQFDVVFSSTPASKALENEVLYVFNTNAKFFVHNYREVDNALSSEQLAQFQTGSMTSELVNQLCGSFGTSEILSVVVRELDVVDGDYFFVLEGRLYQAGRESPLQSLYQMGFCRDRRDRFRPILLSNVLLLLLGLAVYAGLRRMRTDSWPPFPSFPVLPLVAFLVGRALPWILGPAVSAIAPDAEALAKLSMWWPPAAGAALFIGPLAVYKIASSRAKNFAPILDISGKSGAVFGVIGLGVAAYFSTAVFSYLGSASVSLYVPFVICVVVGSYTIGCALDRADNLPLYAAAIPAIALFGLGAAACHLSVAYSWTCACIACLPLGYVGVARVGQTKQDEEEEIAEAEGVPADVGELARRAENPVYQRLDVFNMAWRKGAAVLDGKTAVVVLAGPAGAGKTATANEQIAEAARRLKSEGKQLVVLRGECSEEPGQSTPFMPFRTALAKHFGINVFTSPEPQLKVIDAALDGVFESVVPFSGLLFPPQEETPASSQKEVFLSVATTLRKLSSKGAVALFIDDVQWIDDSSKELLSFLLESFPDGGAVPLLILVTTRDPHKIRDLSAGQEVLDVKGLDRSTQTRLLVSAVGLRNPAARRIVESVGGGAGMEGELFWLFHVVAYLARIGAFRKEEDGFGLAEDYRKMSQLPVPDELRQAIREELQKHPQYRTVLQCAACLGFQFNSEVLAQSLEMSRLKLLQVLEEIEDQTGILTDVRELDDVYAFRSSSVLAVIKEEMSAELEGPRSTAVPQLVREYHARLAASLEKSLEESSGALFDVAKHYYAAGVRHSGKALDYCLRAARSASAMFNHDQAREYLRMAEECADVGHRSAETEQEFLFIACYEAHIEGRRRRETAQSGLSYLQVHPEASLAVMSAVARVCYDAASESRDQALFAEAAHIGQNIVSKAETPVGKAEGHHYVGISLGLSQAEERERNLREALRLLRECAEDDLAAQSLLAQVANSLAEQLSYGPPESRKEARQLFEESIGIKSRTELRDLAGLARSHGGLGRLAFFADPPDTDTARIHFQKDLELSEKTGDIPGQSKMHSLLGGCAVKEQKHDEAVKHYRASFDLAESAVDKLFAGAGLLTSLCKTDAKEELNATGTALLAYTTANGIPQNDHCVRAMGEALGFCAELTGEPWLSQLRKALGVQS